MDPGFSKGGCANSQIGIILQFFGLKLHENKRIQTPGRESLVPPIRSTNACGHQSICARKGGDPPEVHTHYVLPSNSVATNDFYMWLVPAAAFDKLHLNPCHNMAHLIMIKY